MVTCPWWDEIYINEAWGSIGGYLGPRLAQSNADTDIAWEEDYLATQGFSGLDTDGRLSSRPMVSQNRILNLKNRNRSNFLGLKDNFYLEIFGETFFD